MKHALFYLEFKVTEKSLKLCWEVEIVQHKCFTSDKYKIFI